MNDTPVTILVSLVVALLFFIIGREIICWYWKINYATQLLEKILQELQELTRKNTNADKSKEEYQRTGPLTPKT